MPFQVMEKALNVKPQAVEGFIDNSGNVPIRVVEYDRRFSFRLYRLDKCIRIVSCIGQYMLGFYMSQQGFRLRNIMVLSRRNLDMQRHTSRIC